MCSTTCSPPWPARPSWRCARLPGDEPARKNLREIEKVGQRGAALARQLLAFSGRQVLHPQVLQLNHLLTGLEEASAASSATRSSSGWTSTPISTGCCVDPEQIEQVIMNLVSNARDVMPQGGQVTLETRTIEVRRGEPHPPPAASTPVGTCSSR